MPRAKRKSLGGYFYHVMNRANGKLKIFKKPGDFEAFENILGQGQERFGMRICGYCIMGNHWHLLLWPENDGDLSAFMKWITVTHTNRYHSSHGTTGMGHIYKGRYKSFPVQGNINYLKVLRYIEANPLRANLADDAADWQWTSYHKHARIKTEDKPLKICTSPKRIPKNWPELVTDELPEIVISQLENAIKRGCPFGDSDWIEQAAVEFELQSTMKPIGRPKIGV